MSKKLMLRQTENDRFIVHLNKADKYTKKHHIIIETQVYDAYDKKWCDARKTSLFLSKSEITKLTKWLGKV